MVGRGIRIRSVGVGGVLVLKLIRSPHMKSQLVAGPRGPCPCASLASRGFSDFSDLRREKRKRPRFPARRPLASASRAPRRGLRRAAKPRGRPSPSELSVRPIGLREVSSHPRSMPQCRDASQRRSVAAKSTTWTNDNEWSVHVRTNAPDRKSGVLGAGPARDPHAGRSSGRSRCGEDTPTLKG